MMWDCNFRNDAEDEDVESKYDVLSDLLNNKLTNKKHGLPFLDAFVLTHSDEDHCRGFKDKFFLDKPEKITQEDKDANKILIGELWYSPRVIMESDMSKDAEAFKKEAERRMELYKKDKKEASKDGNRIRIIGWAKEDKLEGLEDRITVPGNEINEVNGKTYSSFRMFIHSPFKDEIEHADRNQTSVVMQIRIDCGNTTDAGKVVLAGDCEWHVWEKIVEVSDDATLTWDLFEAPHHCSWSFFGDDRKKGDMSQSSLDFLDKREEGAMMVSSSKYITRYDSDPPCEKAKNRYVERVGEDNFFCTGGDTEDADPAPVVFELKSNGFHHKTSSKKDEKSSKNSRSQQPHVYGDILR